MYYVYDVQLCHSIIVFLHVSMRYCLSVCVFVVICSVLTWFGIVCSVHYKFCVWQCVLYASCLICLLKLGSYMIRNHIFCIQIFVHSMKIWIIGSKSIKILHYISLKSIFKHSTAFILNIIVTKNNIDNVWQCTIQY